MDYGKILQFALEQIIMLVLVPLLGLGVGLLIEKVKEVRASKNGKDFDQAVKIISELVHAAEMAGIKGMIEAEGRAKKELVLNLAQDELSRRNIKMDVHVVSALIEAEVYKAFEQFKEGVE